MAPPTDEERIDIWRIDLLQPTSRLPSLHALLSPAEQTRAARFVYPRDRDRYLVAHAALRTILAPLAGASPADLAFDEGPHGKPFLAGHPIHFNLTHAADLALVAISPTHRVGIDLELLRPMPDALSLAEQFHPNELVSLRATHPDPLAFFTCWTRKEAFVKATGEGLSRPLSSFDTTTPIPGWHLVEIPIPGYAATLATEAVSPNPPSLNHRTWHPHDKP